ncbi:THO complex subunit 2, partial [Ophiophagus hannah]
MNWPQPEKWAFPDLVTTSSIGSPSECCGFTLWLLIGKNKTCSPAWKEGRKNKGGMEGGGREKGRKEKRERVEGRKKGKGGREEKKSGRKEKRK